METNYKRYLVALILVILVIPHIALAAWWNPFTWKVFISNKTPKVQVQEVQNATTTQATSTTAIATPTSKVKVKNEEKDILINALKKQVAELAQKVNQPSQQKVETPKISVITLPSGAIVETDKSGNIVRIVKEAPASTIYVPAPVYTPNPIPTLQPSPSQTSAQTIQNTGVTNINSVPTPTSVPTPKTKPQWNVKIVPLSYQEPVKTPDGGGYPDKRRLALFLSNAQAFFKPDIAVEINSPQFGLDFSGLRINGVKLEKIAQNTYIFPTDKNLDFTGSEGYSEEVRLERMPREDGYPPYTLTVTIRSVQNNWSECSVADYSSCSFPTFPITNTIIIDPK